MLMIIGAFGVGKTTLANELSKQLNNSMIYDPEQIGFVVRNIIPKEIKQIEAKTCDIQDFE